MTSAYETIPLTGSFEGAASKIPSHRGIPFLGVYFAFKKNPLAFMQQARGRYGPLVRMPLMGFPFVLVGDAHLAHKVMAHDMGFFGKSRSAKRSSPLVGEGLILSEGDKWLRMRKLASPFFHPKKLALLTSRMEAICSLHLKEEFASFGGVISVEKSMTRLAMSLFSECFLGLSKEDAGYSPKAMSKLHAAFYGAMGEVSARSLSGLCAPMWAMTPSVRRLKSHIRVIDDAMEKIIKERRRLMARGVIGDDFLSCLLSASESEAGFSWKEARDELVTFMLAGHETTATALTWLVYHIACHPNVAAKLQEEISAFSMANLNPSFFKELSYTHKVIKESLRLSPPVWMFRREAKESGVFCGYKIKKGDIFMISPYLLQRDPRYWPNPDAFDPSRVSQGGEAFFPFGIGKRHCIGMNFAMMEMGLFLVALFKGYRFSMQEGLRLGVKCQVTLKPDRDFNIKLSSNSKRKKIKDQA